MHATLLSVLHAATSPSTTTKSKGSSSSSYIFIVVIGLFAIVYFFVLRPRTQRARQQQQTKKDFALGDEVVSIGGIVGSVVGFDGDDVEVEVDEGVVLTFLRRAINLKQPPAAAAAAPVGLFGRRPRPAPPADDDDDFDDDDDVAVPGSSNAGSGSKGSKSGRGDVDGGASDDVEDPPSAQDNPGGGPDSPPTGR
jgi:preprotein translocase subunit YajC